MKRYFFLTIFFALSSLSFGVDLVQNGNFEANPPEDGWAEFSSGQSLIIGDWSSTIVDSDGDFGPPTNTAWLGGYDDAQDRILQAIQTPATPVIARLSFDWAFTDEDVANFDFFNVKVGDDVVFTTFLGGGLSGTLSSYKNESINVSNLMDGTLKGLVFEVLTDDSLACSVFVDNISLTTAPVPEPASMAILGLGSVLMLCRRKLSKSPSCEGKPE